MGTLFHVVCGAIAIIGIAATIAWHYMIKLALKESDRTERFLMVTITSLITMLSAGFTTIFALLAFS